MTRLQRAAAWLADARKALAAAAGAAAMLAAAGLLHGTLATVAEVVVVLATAVGVYQTPPAVVRRQRVSDGQ
jgi:putative intracellular protease/amidase